MKQLLCTALLVCLSFSVYGTAQIPDIIIYKKDTLALNNCPLDSILFAKQITPKDLFGSDGCFFTACWRGYIATWEVIDDKIYLSQVRNACYPTELKNVAASYKRTNENGGTEYADLQKLFPEKYKTGKVFADWVTDSLFLPFGKLLYYVHNGFESSYEYEYKLTVKNGIILKEEKLDNTKTRESIFSKPPENKKDTIFKYIQSNIDWSKLPTLPLDSILVVRVSFSANEDGVIDEVNVFGNSLDEFKNEAIRVVKTIPWRVIYFRGKHRREGYMLPVRFSQPLNKIEQQNFEKRDSLIANYTYDRKIDIIKQQESINDSIKLLYYKEKRIENTGKYVLRYIFIDYNPENKYLKQWIEDDRNILPVYLKNQKMESSENYFNLEQYMGNCWHPLMVYDENVYNSREIGYFIKGSKLYDTVNETLFDEIKVFDDNYLRLYFKWGEEKRYLDIFFVDKEHTLMVIKFSDQRFPKLYVNCDYSTNYQSIIFHNRWNDTDMSNASLAIEWYAWNNLPEDIVQFRDKIRTILKISY